MTLRATEDLVAAAVARGGAVPAVNVITLEHAEAIVDGAADAGADVLLQVSQNAVKYHGGALRPLLAACRELAAGAPVGVAVHLDHLDDPQLVAAAIDLGGGPGGAAGGAQHGPYGHSSLMVDFSVLPYAENLRATAEATARAHAAGLWVEAELGEVGGKDGAHAPGVRTDPGEAAAFVAATGVDALAVAVGSSHAMTSRTASLDVELVALLAAAVPVPLVLHGSSGVPDDVLAAAVRAGIRKVNVGTALNVAGTAALRRVLDADAALVDPRRPLRESRAAMAGVVTALCRTLSAA
ncbi:class II fructose-bisphosphate aldolase [Quadrisphaera sp. KR29]|uniref:class II fructose-bisphosphate aldolase n=1 Tax=Quadrisphaera sp. KR29 TaxID=3461391 RepID=UPI004043A549